MTDSTHDSSIPELVRLRRFSLVIGLVLLTYTSAQLQLDATGEVHPFGLPFKIASKVFSSIWNDTAARALTSGRASPDSLCYC